MGKASREKRERRESRKSLRLWHYTTEIHFRTISEDGMLKPTSIAIDAGERPALWLSSNPNWERTVTKTFPLEKGGFTGKLQRDDMVKVGVTPMRVEMELDKISFVDWKTFKKISGISSTSAKNLEDVARESGARPDEWFASFHAIPVRCWKTIEFWDGQKWITYELDNLSNQEQHELQRNLDQIYVPSIEEAEKLGERYRLEELLEEI